jgi:hypothetical protein
MQNVLLMLDVAVAALVLQKLPVNGVGDIPEVS